MMDWLPLISGGLTAIVLPAGGYVVKKVFDINDRVIAHEARDEEAFQDIKAGIEDLKEGQQLVLSHLLNGSSKRS